MHTGCRTSDCRTKGDIHWTFLKPLCLRVGKLQDKTKQFCTENGLQGDPRKWLWKMPYNIVREYAMGDVTQPLEIFRIQWEIMKERELLEVFLLETKNIRAIMHMRSNGVYIDTKRRDVNAYIATTEA